MIGCGRSACGSIKAMAHMVGIVPRLSARPLWFSLFSISARPDTNLLCPRSRQKTISGGSAAGTRSCWYSRGLHRAGDGALETTVDQALIRGLGTALRVCVSGLSSF
jgi:hypothetical protein